MAAEAWRLQRGGQGSRGRQVVHAPPHPQGQHPATVQTSALGRGLRLQAKYPAGNSCNNPSEPDDAEENGETGWS